jgi:hypothetical protein
MKGMRWVFWLGLFFPVGATTSLVSVEPTQMQAKVTVHTDQSGNCSYRVSRGSSFSSNIPDLSENGNTDARAGSLVNGSEHIFVAGTRKGADALAADASYWVGVTCGSDAEVSISFTTLRIPWGNLAPDPVPFNAARFGNMDYPVIDWTNQGKSYVDPLEGVEFWRLTGPGLLDAGSFTAYYNQTTQAPIDLAGSGKWANLPNAATNSKSYATASGSATDRIFIPLAAGNFYGSSGWLTKTNVDDILVNVYCGSATQSGITLTLQLSLDGGQTVLGSPVTTAACPQSSPAKVGTYPQASALPLFKGWNMSPPQHNLVIPPSGTVSVSGSIATLQSPNASNNYFVTEWASGSPISIGGAYYHIASIQSPTQLTLAENPGTLANVPFVGANAGLVLYKSGAGSASVSVGVDLYGSSVVDAGLNGDSPMVNPIPISISRTADGSAALNPPLTGYLAYITSQGGSGSVLLWIPYNADGSPRNEVRLLSIGVKPGSSQRLHGAGDTFIYTAGVSPQAGVAWDGVDGKSWFGLAADNVHFFRMTYDETQTGCAGYPSYSPYPGSNGYNNGTANVADDCFQWFNLTPSSSNPPMDIKSQMIRGYQTGLNSLGQNVGPAHPNFDLGWFGRPGASITGGGFFTANITNAGEHLTILASFDSQSGVLKMIKNLWGGDGDTESRWGGIHSIALGVANWRWAAMNGLDDNTGATGQQVFNTAFDLPIIKVNRAGYGAAAQWDANTAVGGTEAYTCPQSVPARYANLAGTKNCIQVKVSTPPCSATPNSTYTFPDGKTEKDEFPCSTPGFGVADPTRSKLMDIQAGDWLRERRTGPLNEQFVALTVTYNGTNDIDLWLLRWGVHNYLLPLLGNMDDYSPTYDARSNGWLLSMAPTLNNGPLAMAMDVSAGGAAKWIPDNPKRSGCHGVIGPGTAPGLYIYSEPCDPPNYRGTVDLPVSQMLFQPLRPTAATYPGFAGTSNGVKYGTVQGYTNNSWWFGAAKPPYQLDFRHLNPSYGAGAEYLGSSLGSRTLTLVPGTSKSYSISDPVSAGPWDFKRLPLYGYAGHYLLQDVSGPAIGNTADLPDYSVCRAFKTGECFAGSSAGNLYVGVPRAYVDGNCHTDQFTLPSPCAFQLAPVGGQVIQFRVDKTDSMGLSVRKLGYVHGMPGLQYQFSNCRATPDAVFAFCVADWLDGVRSEWVALRLKRMADPDAVNRTTFVPKRLTYQGSPDASYIRARFGYLENGGSLLRCTSYQVECSTEIPSSAATDPYSFTNEAVTRQLCANGATCTITIPAISNRMLYYVVDRLDTNGNVVSSYPTNVEAIP